MNVTAQSHAVVLVVIVAILLSVDPLLHHTSIPHFCSDSSTPPLWNDITE
jgi:hypothetical protein